MGKNPFRITLLGGGTGGHIYPLLAVAEELKKINGNSVKLFYLGSPGRFEKDLRNTGVIIRHVASSKWRSYNSILNIVDCVKFGIGLFQSIIHFVRIRPHAIFTKGGPGTVPIILASRLWNIPIVVHESDAIPGKSNRIAGRFASIIELAFQDAQKYFTHSRVRVCGLPLRKEFYTRPLESKEAKRYFGFDGKKPVLLIICGSQGAQSINIFIDAHIALLRERFDILHQRGESSKITTDDATHGAGDKGYRAFPYFTNDIITAYDASDVILSRAGATTIFEIMARKKFAILVPLPHSAHNHQLANARACETQGVARVIEEQSLTIDVFLKSSENRSTGQPLREDSSFITPEAGRQIANDIIELATTYKRS